MGVDLAWGDRQPDGVCVIDYWPGDPPRGVVRSLELSHGDDALLDLARGILGSGIGEAASTVAYLEAQRTFWAVDGPLICRNDTGSRPVDKLTHVHFGRQHAGCYPANLRLTPRPPRLLAAWQQLGFQASLDLADGRRLVAEVYPHIAMLRWFQLNRVLKYKRPPRANQRAEFTRYQDLLSRFLTEHLPWLDTIAAQPDLHADHRKPVEDRLDAFTCALIALWHVHHAGRASESLGDPETGLLLLPQLPPPPGDENEPADAWGWSRP